MIVGSNGGCVTHAAFQWRPSISTLTAGIGIDVVCGEVESREEVGGDVYLHTLHITLVAVLIESILFEFGCFIIRHLWELLTEHYQRSVRNFHILLNYHIIDTVHEPCHTDGKQLGAILCIQREIVTLLG